MTKCRAYTVVADSEENEPSDVIVQGQEIVPVFDRRKRDVGIWFVAGLLVGILLSTVVVCVWASSGRKPQQLPESLVPQMSSSLNLQDNFTTIRPLEPPLRNQSGDWSNTNNDTTTPSANNPSSSSSSSSSSWWSKATSTVSGWFGSSSSCDQNTKLAGGGRDWLVDAQTGLVATKLDPNFRLGVGPAPLILVRKDSNDALIFLQSPSRMPDSHVDLLVGEPNDGFVGISNVQPIVVEGYAVFDAVVSPFVEPLTVTYRNDTFLVYNDDYVLEVADWKIVENMPVRFVKPKDNSLSFIPGAGRDWIWNEDGSISPKLNHELVLGCGTQGLIITNREEEALHLSHAQELANGDVIPMELSGSNHGIGATELHPTIEDGCLYREAVLVNVNPIHIHYDGNFLLTSKEDFVLDITDGKLQQGQVVRFVGSKG